MTSHDAGLVGAVWQKSSYSGGNGGQCVEVARNLPGVVAVRDSKDPGGPSLVVTAREWLAFIDGLRRGGFGPAEPRPRTGRAQRVSTPSHRPSA